MKGLEGKKKIQKFKILDSGQPPVQDTCRSPYSDLHRFAGHFLLPEQASAA